ncbi:glycosyltransferase [Acidipila sp. EB88]|uniref:glycosyltransferase n=1 Tax=Acidipila sp. EB88 TaxID=2305226 RepID=UPI000F5FF83D|nr:glycosyltransferase [Acidipila sp. EB88]RRA50155.1 glycosyltransferase [Acidipila sp. EB88]
MLRSLFLVGVVGLFSSTIFAAMVAVGVRRFARERRRAEGPRVRSFASAVSLFKPLHGAEPNLHEHLATFFAQDYPGPYEILFCARHTHDAGMEIARQVAAQYPHIPVQFLAVEGTPFVNAKVSSLERMGALASHDIFLISDSDVRVTPAYIREVVSDFADPEIGAVTCLYRGIADRGIWSKLEAAGMSIEMTAGVLAANLVEDMQFLLGPTMAVRRAAVERMGGFAKLGPYCSDDYLLGNWVAALGYKVMLSPHVIDHIVLNLTFLTSMKHQIRWMKSTRFSRPKGHFGTGLTFSVPFGLLAFASAAALHHAWLGVALLAYGVGSRMALALLLGLSVVKESALLRTVLLYPLRDLMGFIYWVLSYTSGKILWRGELYRLGENGLMQSARD